MDPWVNRLQALKGFKGENQHLELYPETYWQPMPFTKQWYYVCQIPNTLYYLCRCILCHLKLLNALQGHAECVAVVQTKSHKGMSYVVKASWSRNGCNLSFVSLFYWQFHLTTKKYMVAALCKIPCSGQITCETPLTIKQPQSISLAFAPLNSINNIFL